MELKPFQRTALDTLETYLERARVLGDPEQAFFQVLKQKQGSSGKLSSYRAIKGLEDVPNVCLRLPTGGGKTLLAAHTVALAGRAFLERDYPLVLWMTPTNTIRRQTAEALKKPSHPYRAALDDAFDGRVSVFDLSEITQIRPQDLVERVCIVVITLQALRVSNTEGRKAYAHSESFEPHFTHVPSRIEGLERNKDGTIKFSFVNLMAVHRPLVIVDEAHKAGTNLSFDMLAALRPACIIEFTATPNTDPRTGSNVLFRASAAEVRAAEMIKLPIVLTEHPDWRAAIHGALENRAQLAHAAQGDPGHIRPLVLFQAQDKGQEVTVEVLKNYLIENENIAAERIAIATGEQRELDHLNLFDRACKVDFIITVEALKEGWDCSFAYVLCSVANVGSATDIEQLLGRVLRMPYTQNRANPALNRAYAHISSRRFGEGARALVDTLVEKMGFEVNEAATMVEQRQETLPGVDWKEDLFTSIPVLLETLDTAPDLQGLDADITTRVKVDTRPDGAVTVSIEGEITEELENRLLASVTASGRLAKMRAAIYRHRVAYGQSLSPAQRGESFPVPRLFLNLQGELELAEETLILDLGGWTLNDYAAELSPTEFTILETAERWEVDLQGEKVIYKHVDQSTQLEMDLLDADWTNLKLSQWLDRQCRQTDLTQPVVLEFCRKIVVYLLNARRLSLSDLVRFKYALAKAVQHKIAAYRKQAYANSYQNFLFSPSASVETRFDGDFSFESRPYPAAWTYQGSYQFKKHFHGLVGELDAKGEEFECAQFLDTLPQVKHWIRNLANHPESSFWLPTSTDRFYPDFVAKLHDGRIAVIEYKGAHLADTADTLEKLNIGQLWADKSDGKGIFLMAMKRNAQGQDLLQQLTAGLG